MSYCLCRDFNGLIFWLFSCCCCCYCGAEDYMEYTNDQCDKAIAWRFGLGFRGWE